MGKQFGNYRMALYQFAFSSFLETMLLGNYRQEYLDQIRQAYEAQIGIEQNNLMKFFTVVTSIFLPLSLIAGWYGMNLIMPEFGWAYSYPFVIALSVGIIAIMLWLFRKNKWL